MRHAKAFLTALVALVVMPISASFAGHAEKTLHTFVYGTDGAFPFSGVTLDKHGNIFGTTDLGGPGTCGAGCGKVFEITGGKNGTFKVIHVFQGSLSDGGNPNGAMIFDAKGNLYGTAVQGGDAGCGVVFELSPQKNGQWTETILHSFNSQTGNDDGCNPYSTLVFDEAGNLYGTTNKGGGGGVGGTFCQNGCGTVFELSPKGGKWKEKVIHAFPGTKGNLDGQNPYAGLAFDSHGNLWGTTQAGGTGGTACNPQGTPPGCGTVFELTPTVHGAWFESLVYSFLDAGTGWYPYAGVVIDANDNVYGSLVNGADNGAIFKMVPQLEGGVIETLIYTFAPCDAAQGCTDGLHPFGGLHFDAAGNLYGTTIQGGAASNVCGQTNTGKPVGCGTVFKLSPNGNGPWNETILYRFTGAADGASPSPDTLAIDAKGTVLGTAPDGGDLKEGDCPGEVGCGVVFAVKP